jgi:hypothetical protein
MGEKMAAGAAWRMAVRAAYLPGATAGSECRISLGICSRCRSSSTVWSRANRAQPGPWPCSRWTGRPSGARSVTCCPHPAGESARTWLSEFPEATRISASSYNPQDSVSVLPPNPATGRVPIETIPTLGEVEAAIRRKIRSGCPWSWRSAPQTLGSRPGSKTGNKRAAIPSHDQPHAAIEAAGRATFSDMRDGKDLYDCMRSGAESFTVTPRTSRVQSTHLR